MISGQNCTLAWMCIEKFKSWKLFNVYRVFLNFNSIEFVNYSCQIGISKENISPIIFFSWQYVLYSLKRSGGTLCKIHQPQLLAALSKQVSSHNTMEAWNWNWELQARVSSKAWFGPQVWVEHKLGSIFFFWVIWRFDCGVFYSEWPS